MKVKSGSIADHSPGFLELCPFPLALWNETRRKCLFNNSSCKLLGFSRAELENNPQIWDSQIHSADLPNWRAEQNRVSSEKCHITCDYRFHRKNAAAPIWLRETVLPLHLPDSSWKFISAYVDISDLKGKLPPPASPASSDALRGLFHDLNNKLQRLSMEIELAAIEGNIEPELSRKLANALAGVNQGLTLIHEQCVGPKSRARVNRA